MIYRPEIDGLRAVAVLPVIFYHAGFAFAHGGYIGVDVFFVISGYLITSLIVEEKVAGTFSLASFYERRMRRLLPALFIVLFAAGICAWMLFTPQQLSAFGASVVATSLFASNFYFLHET
ncbi:MAG TPA: acyltransferase, partial [Pseudomonadales bacterium]|nr:acyltransferase [Pseudomonadales bacterium]